MRVDHLNSLRALEAVLRTGGLRPAAEALSVTPAAVGQQIRTLEAYLGQTLLDRSPTGSLPTPQAQSVSAALSQHIAGLGDVLHQLKSQKPDNRISISVLPSIAETWFPRHLGSLFTQIPGVDLRLDASHRLVDLYDGEFDFAIRHTSDPSADFEALLLFDDYCAPICTPDFARRYDLSPDATSLEEVPMAEIDVDALQSSSKLPILMDWCREFGITVPHPTSGQVILDHSTGLRLASSGLAIYLAGIQEVIEDLASGAVILPFGPKRAIKVEYSFWLVWRKESRLSPVQKSFLNWISDHAAKDRARMERLLAP